MKSRDCDYHDYSDEMILDRIVYGTNSPKIHEKLINVGKDLTLQKAVQIGQNYEYAQEQMKQMTPNDVHMVKPKTKRRVKRSNRSGSTMGQRQSYAATLWERSMKYCQSCQKLPTSQFSMPQVVTGA